MIEIPAGEFLMGSPSDEFGRDSDEGPQHRVSISAFQMGETEVTQSFHFERNGSTYAGKAFLSASTLKPAAAMQRLGSERICSISPHPAYFLYTSSWRTPTDSATRLM